jgi:hypothetical protein
VLLVAHISHTPCGRIFYLLCIMTTALQELKDQVRALSSEKESNRKRGEKIRVLGSCRHRGSIPCRLTRRGAGDRGNLGIPTIDKKPLS